MESCTSCLTLSISKAVCLCILWSARAQYIERASQCGAYAICVFVTTPRPSGCTTIKWRGAAFQWTPSSGSFCCFVYFNLHTKKEQKTRVGGLFVGWVSLGYKKKKNKNKKNHTHATYSRKRWLLFMKFTRAFCVLAFLEARSSEMSFASFFSVSIISIVRGIKYCGHSVRKCCVVSGTLQVWHNPVSCFPIFLRFAFLNYVF